MTPNPKHIEEARRLANDALSALGRWMANPQEGGSVNVLFECLNLPTLLAAQEDCYHARRDERSHWTEFEKKAVECKRLQEELEKLRKSTPDPIRDHFAACPNCKPVMCCSGNECGCQGLPVDFEPTDKCDNYCLNLTHRRLLEAKVELEKWKLGCKTNADCYRTAVRAQDEQRLELTKLRADLQTHENLLSNQLRVNLEVCKELSEIRADRDELMQFLWKETGCGQHTTIGEAQERYSERMTELRRLRTRETALLAVARAAKDVRDNIVEHGSHDNWKTMANAISALEPLGIKV